MSRRKPIKHRIDIYKDHRFVMSAYFRSRTVSWLFHVCLNKAVTMADGELAGSYNPVYIE